MDTRYADAMVALEDAISSAASRAEHAGLTDKEVADELRRIADQLDAPKTRKTKP
jgi:hypothetical protein